MTRRKKSNVCPVCGVQGRLRVLPECINGVKFVEYVVFCRCDKIPYAAASKKWAWWWFRNWRTFIMRISKNYPRKFVIRKREDIRAGRLPRTAINLKIHNARLKHS